MIDLYSWSTPNGRKASILLEELGEPYTVHPIDVGSKAQFDPDYLKLNPNNKVPTVVDRETGVVVMESAAIMIYLTDKFGRLAPREGPARYDVLQWLMWQTSSATPMLTQAHHYLHFNPGKAPYAEERLAAEAKRLYGVLESRLDGRDFICDEYSIADIGLFPVVCRFAWQGIDLNALPNVKRWYLDVAARPAVQKGYKIPADRGDIPMP